MINNFLELLKEKRNIDLTLYDIIGPNKIKKVTELVLQEIKFYEFLESNMTILDLKNACKNFIIYISDGPFEYERNKNTQFDIFLKMGSMRFEEFKNGIVNVLHRLNIDEVYINQAIEKLNKERLLVLENE